MSELLNADRFRVVAGIGAAIVFAIVLYLRFDYDPPTPRRPPRPSRASAASLASLDYSQGLYKAQLVKDSRDFGVSEVAPEHISGVLAYDLAEPHATLTFDGKTIETRDVRMSARLEQMDAVAGKGTVRVDHIILKIENKTDHAIAYRVDTTSSLGKLCYDKGAIKQNAIALAARAVSERTECVVRPNAKNTLVVDRVETLILPPLSFYYVSRLHPTHIGLDPRVTSAHAPPRGDVCQNIPEQAIRRASEKGLASWRDVIDFYARHNCDKYLFPVGYRAFSTANQYNLPVPPSGVTPRP